MRLVRSFIQNQKKLLFEEIVRSEDKSLSLEAEKEKLIASQNLWYYSKYVLGYSWLDDYHKRWLDEIQDLWDNHRPFRVMVLKPRGTGKTSCYSQCFLSWIFTLNPNLRAALLSATENVATQILSGNKFIFEGKVGEKYLDFWGNLSVNSGRWNMKDINLNNRTDFSKKEPNITCFGAKGNPVSGHYDFLLFEDVCNLDDHKYPAIREGRKMFFSSTMSLVDKETSILIVGTYWDDEDMYNYIEDINDELENKFVILKEQAWEETEDGKKIYNFPSILSEKKLHDLEISYRKDPVLFFAQYQNDPVPLKGRVFPRDRIVCYRPENVTNYKKDTKILYIDPSKGKKTGDWTAIVLMIKYVLRNKDYVIEDVFLGIADCLMLKVPLEVVTEEVNRLLIEYAMRMFYCEATGNLGSYGKYIRDMLQKYFDKPIYYSPIEHQSSKQARIQSIGFAYKSGEIRFLEDDLRSYDYRIMVEQMYKYRTDVKDQEDDGPDAVAGAYECSEMDLSDLVIND